MSTHQAAEVAAWGSKLVETSKSVKVAPTTRPQAAARSDDPHRRCRALAQRLVDEEQELQNCETILHDNERKFRERRAELLDALADVQRSLKPILRASADDVKLKEEALWHMQATCERLEKEEADQGEAVVRLVDCVSCAEECKVRSVDTMRDMAVLLHKGVFPLISELREVCSGFPFVGDLGETEFRDDIVALRRLEPLGHEDDISRICSAVHHVLHHLEGGVDEFRASARDRLRSILHKGDDMRQECDAQAGVVEEAHMVLTQLKEQQQETVEAVDGTQKIVTQLSQQIERKNSSMRDLQRIIGDLSAQCEATNLNQRRMSERKEQLLREIDELKQAIRVATDATEGLHRSKLHDESVHSDLSSQLEACELKVSASRQELAKLQRDIDEDGGDMGKVKARLAGLRESEASTRAASDACKETIAQLTIDIGSLSHKESTCARSIDDVRSKIEALQKEEGAMEDKAALERTLHQDQTEALKAAQEKVADEERSTTDLERDIQTAKKLLLEMKRPPATPIVTASSLELSPSPTRSLPVEDARAAIRSFRASRVENAVVTAPLKRLLVTNERSPVTVPLEVRHHRREAERGRVARPDEIRARMVAARSPSP